MSSTCLKQAEASGIVEGDSQNQIPHFTEHEKLKFDVDGCVDAHDRHYHLALQNSRRDEPDAIVTWRVTRVGPFSIGRRGSPRRTCTL